MYATCHTNGCANQGAPIRVPDGAETVLCGVCTQPITDVTDTPTALPEELPPWLD